MSKSTRKRQLQKLAERRAAERRRHRRRRVIAASVAGALVLGAGGATALTLLRGGEDPTASESPTPGPTEEPPAEVACGGDVPEAAGEDKPTFDRPPRMRIDRSKDYVAVIDTSCGRVTAELFAGEAPENVNSFVFLANERFFNGLTFHRLEPGFVVQGGDPNGDGSGGPGYTLPDELDNELDYEVGTLAMANSGPDTSGSQFFIITGDQGADLPKQYTIFGRVTKGMKVLERIDGLPVAPNPDGQTNHPTETIYIERITIRER
ncbi:MAG: peptidylprolyl isomerase [Actinomycetota bacterium]